MKPIIFNTEMVRAALDGRKTVTQRVVKPQPPATAYVAKIRYSWSWSWWEDSDSHEMKPTYRPGDILYVRETWCWCPCWDCGMDTDERCVDEIAERFYNAKKAEWGCYGYKASFAPDEAPFDRWHPSIHMPKEAARLFLRVISVRIERLQDITDAEAQKEGAVDREDLRRIWNNCYSKPRPVKDKHGVIDHYESYPWEDVMETRTFRGKPWHVIGNPWVWVVEFERVSREEAGNA